MNIEEYRSHIDRLIREMNGETVLNGSHAHASIILERMFANANNCVNILSRKFDPRIYGTSEAVEQAKLLLGDPERSISILLEEVDEDEIRSHPFFRKLSHFTRDNLKLRRLPPDVAHAVAINFAIMDDSGYRLEQDKSHAVAVASFGGDREFVGSLKSFFDRLWGMSEAVPIAVTA